MQGLQKPPQKVGHFAPRLLEWFMGPAIWVLGGACAPKNQSEPVSNQINLWPGIGLPGSMVCAIVSPSLSSAQVRPSKTKLLFSLNNQAPNFLFWGVCVSGRRFSIVFKPNMTTKWDFGKVTERSPFLKPGCRRYSKKERIDRDE